MNLNQLMKNGVDGVLQKAARFYLESKAGRAFLANILPQAAKSARLRDENEKNGVHVPLFLIASIASQCNLRCAGCYARSMGACSSRGAQSDLSAGEWAGIFKQASELGVLFILLAGGEPLTRRDVLTAAADFPGLMFPVFTNGTMFDRSLIELFEGNRNLIPMFSLEGDKALTDARRGPGVYDRVESAMLRLQEKGMLFGVSITVTKENMKAVTAPEFVSGLGGRGCGAAGFVEYVPTQEDTEYLALDEEGTADLVRRTSALKERLEDMAVLSFPGDEAAMGGCLAAGRGFFHINSTGGAEPCPFSPYSRFNLRETSIRQALNSEYFAGLRAIASREGPHLGGCTLFERKGEVEALLAGEAG